MGHFSSMFNGLARSFTNKKSVTSGNYGGREAVEVMFKEAKKNDLILHSSGFINAGGSNNFTSLYSKRGEKGVNQDCFIVWEVCDKIGKFIRFTAENLKERTMGNNILSIMFGENENVHEDSKFSHPLSYIFLIATK